MSKQSNIEKLQHESKDLSKLEPFKDITKKSPVAQFFVSTFEALPYVGSAVNTASSIIECMYTKKLHTLLTAITKTPILDIPTDELMQRGAIAEWFLIADAIKKVRSKQKIETLGKLYKNTYLTEIAPLDLEHDQFEEWASILIDMSDREMDILVRLYDKEKEAAQNFQSKYAATDSFWESFVSETCNRYDILEEELYAILNRLLRTGFYRNDFKEIGNLQRENPMGYTTLYFKKFLEKIEHGLLLVS